MRWLVLAAFATMVLGAPAMAYDYSPGDRACVGYDPATHTCASIQEILSIEGDDARTRERMLLQLGTIPLAVEITYEIKQRGDQYCLVPDATIITLSPPMHAQAGALQAFLRDRDAMLTTRGICSTHQVCGDLILIKNFMGGVEMPELEFVVRHFPYEDPRNASLKTRSITIQERAGAGRSIPQECRIPAS